MNELMGLFDGDDARERSPSAYQDGPADVATDAGEPEEEEEEEEEDDEEEEEEEEEEDETDFDLSEFRPVKRSRSSAAAAAAAAASADSQTLPALFGAAGSSGRSTSSSTSRRGRHSGSGAVDKDDGMEVIEILSDDEDQQHPSPSSRLRRMFYQKDDNGQFANRFSARDLEDGTTDDVARGASSSAAAGAAARSSQPTSGGLRGFPYRSNSGRTGAAKIGRKMASASDGARRGTTRRGGSQKVAVSSRRGTTVVPPPLGGGGSEEEEEEEEEAEQEAWGKPSAEELAGARGGGSATAEAGVGGVRAGQAAAAAAAASASAALKITPTGDDGDNDDCPTTSSGRAIGPTTSTCPAAEAAGPAPVPVELPLNLECAMCFNPLAIVALFACGHGSCWECAHNWCSRETSATMDCPTCHVSVPRNDFRRCVVLDQVVERAVIAAGMDDDDWRNRLERGQNLAREAEANRRGSRDAQRAAEETIAEQAAELERLREEAKSRAANAGGRRSWRSYDGSRPSMADYGFRLMNGSDSTGGNNNNGNFPDQASHRSALHELARYRHRRGDATGDSGGGASSSARAAAGDAAAVAAAALGISPSGAAYGGGLRSRGHAHPLSTVAASSGFGPAEGEPWFSLRPSQPSRQSAVAMSTGRASREVFARGNLSGRSHAHSAAASGAMSMGLDQSSGAVWSPHDRASNGSGSNWRPAYRNPGGGMSLSDNGRGGGVSSTRSPTLTTNSRATQFRLGAQGSAVERLPASSMGGDHHSAQQALPVRSSRKRYGLRGPEAGSGERGAAARSASPSASPSFQQAGGGAGFAPPGLQFGNLGDRHGRREQQHTSRGGGGGSAGGNGGGGGGYNLQFVGRNNGRPAPVQQAPSLDLEDLMSGQEDTGSRSEWDDVLAAVSMPLQAAEEGLGREGSPGATRG